MGQPREVEPVATYLMDDFRVVPDLYGVFNDGKIEYMAGPSVHFSNVADELILQDSTCLDLTTLQSDRILNQLSYDSNVGARDASTSNAWSLSI